MKRRFLLVLAFLASALVLFADNVTQEQAKKMAIDFFKSEADALEVKTLNMVYDGARSNISPASSQQPAYYVFDNPDGKGFVVVAGDDIAYPILGYSFDHDFMADNLPPNLELWLQRMEERINYGRKMGYASSGNGEYPSKGEVVVDLQTADWNQGDPYNKFIPQIGGQNCLVGCTATATSIVMEYHRHPIQGQGTLPAFTTSSNSLYVPERPLGHKYDWNNMLDEYEYGQYNAAQADAAATLCADVAIGLQSDFGTNSTGAYASNIPALLVDYFGYDKGAIHYDRYNFKNDQWASMIKSELDKKRPVLYTGFNNVSGHAFVLDGYTTNDYFSVNWGWGGYCNGYFLLDALEPQGSGLGGNDDHYNFYQGGVFGLIPDEGGEYIEKMGLWDHGITTNATYFEVGVPFDVEVGMGNIGNTIFVGDLILAKVDKDGKLVEELKGMSIGANTDLKPGWGWNLYTWRNVIITTPIEFGDRVRMLYRVSEESEWIFMQGGEDVPCEIVVGDTKTIAESTIITYNKVSKMLKIQTKYGVKIEFFNSSNEDLASMFSVDGTTATIDASSLPGDTYLLRLSKNQELEEVKIKLN